MRIKPQRRPLQKSVLAKKSPLGTFESSPAIYCRVIGIISESAPLGTVEISSEKRSSVPRVTRRATGYFPGTIVPGYYRSFLRNEPQSRLSQISPSGLLFYPILSQGFALGYGWIAPLGLLTRALL